MVDEMTTEVIPPCSLYDPMNVPLNVIAPQGPPLELSNISPGVLIIGPSQ